MLDGEFEGFKVVDLTADPQVHPLIGVLQVVFNVIDRILHCWVVACLVQNEFLFVSTDIAENTVLLVDRPGLE